MREAKKEKTIVVFLSLILASFSLMGLDKLGKLNWLKRPLEKIGNSIRGKLHQVNFGRPKSDLTSSELGQIVSRNEFLEQENAHLETERESLKKENEAMKKLLGAPLPAQWQFISAQVLEVKDDIMTLGQGSDTGIKEGQVVLWENVLLGRVEKVNPALSKIKLITHKDIIIAAKVMKTDIAGVVKKNSLGVLILDEVLPEKNLEQGQIVATSGKDEVFPTNLLIGKIETIKKNPTAVYQKAVLKPFINFSDLENVFIIQ